MSQEPKFHQIADALRAEIKDGTREPGSKLPSEDELVTGYGVAINTVRNAIRQLAAEGLVVVRPKSGTYVRKYDRILRDANKRLSPAQRAAGRSIWDVDVDPRKRTVEDITVTREVAPVDVVAKLGTEDAIVRRRTFLVDGRRVQHAVSYLPAEIAAGTRIAEPDTGPGGTYARLEELGFPVDNEFDEDYVARMPEASETVLLKLLPMTPVVQVRRVATSAGRVVEVNDMLCAGDAFVFHVRITAS